MIDSKRVFSHTCTLFPGIGTKGRVMIAPLLHSRLDPKAAQAHLVPWGALEAACQVLLGRVGAALEGDTITLECHSKAGEPLRLQTKRESGQFTWVNAGTTVRPYLLLIAEALLFGLHGELSTRWANLLQALKGQGVNFPVEQPVLAHASHATSVKDAMYAVVDTLYYLGKLNSRSELETDIPEPHSWHHTPVLYGGRPTVSAAGVDLSDEGRLMRRAASGVRALLVGPTGCGKTELGKRVGLKVGARLVNIKGRPGMEDRDMIGFVSIKATGPAWVDGPLARAMRCAQSGQRTVLLVDELLRFDLYHRNVFIGMLDELSAEELQAALGHDVPAGQYYVLELPGADEVLYARTDLLSVICTTNAGTSYAQSGEIDPALLRRFQRVMFMTYPDEQAIMPKYEQTCSKSTAKVAYALEVASRKMTQAEGQLLARPMNIGVTLNYLAEVRELLAAGLSETAALREALEVTVIPFCVELTEEGEPDHAAAESLRKTLEKLFRSGIGKAA